ncbi:murein biosynthesis integral membrane protein MurJ [Isoalcanivorax beigongshangi]|uniref:Probable lipid II flippase MurJ n=1 Tax=Isoalcanivorax beigongshangi TaxID=3238810 RepID=A0ABV4AKP8_9GAMM
MSDTPTAAPRRRSGLFASTMVVSVMTLLSRVLGLVRDVVVARMLGVSAGTDAFFVAFRIPNFLRRLFAEGAFNQAFVPVLSEYKERGSQAAVRHLIDRVAGTLGSALLLVTVLGVVGAPLLIGLFAPGFGDDPLQRALAVEMLRLTFPYLFFISLTAFAGAILNAWGRFAVPAFTPVLLNLCMIGAALLLAPLFAPERMAVALAWGVLAAGVAQLLFQLPFLARLSLVPRPKIDTRDEGVVKIMKLMAPALFGVSVSQINLLLDTVLATLLETGSPTWLYYSDRLVELPLGIFGIAIATVILPNLSRLHAGDTPEAFARTLDWGIRLVVLVGLPAAAALAVISTPLLATLFHYGEFSVSDVAHSAASLQAYAFGLLAFMLIKVLAPGFFARQDTRTPVRIGVIALVANMVFNLILVWHLRHVGLALATALSAWLNAGLLWRGLQRDGVYQAAAGWWAFLVRVLVATLAMGLGIHYLASLTGVWFDGSALVRAGWLALVVIAGMAIYLLVLLVMGFKPRHLRRSPL